jgi:hypothetical protein
LLKGHTREATAYLPYASRRNFDKVEKWSGDGRRIEELLFAGSNLAKAQRIFERSIKKRPRRPD